MSRAFERLYRNRRERCRKVMVLLTQDPFLSTRALGRRLGVSNSAIWDDLQLLQRLGYLQVHSDSRPARVLVPFVDASSVTFRSN